MFSWIQNLLINKKTAHENKIFSNALSIADTLDDDTDWIRIVPIGVFPLHHNGPHEITAEHISQMADNFAKTNTDLLFDYEHRSLWGDSIAAGWSGQLEAREDGLYAKYPAFTAKAQQHIQDREYRYLSPVYWLDAMDKSGRDIGAVILHVGLTNTPYLDNEIDHIGNSRIPSGLSEPKSTTDNRTDMKLSKENLAKLGLTEEATEEQVNQAIANSQFSQPQADPATPGTVETIEPEKQKPVPGSGGAQASEKENDRVAALEAKFAEKEAAELAEKADLLVNSAIAQGKILPFQKNAYINYAKSDFTACKKELDELKANTIKPEKMKVNVGTGETGAKTNSSQAFRDYVKEKMDA